MDKAYADWDRGDVHRILYDSPWVKHFMRTKRALEFEVPDQGPSGMELRGYHAKESKDDGAETADFYVRWVSSRTLRQAFNRRMALVKNISPGIGSANANAPQPIDEFQIAVAGPDMSAFDRVREATLRAKCYLVPNSRAKIRPTRVEFARSSDGRVRGVLFHFPRKTAAGEPLISSHDTRVWFFESGAEVEISVTFHPQTMIDDEGLDL
jgi:hypothetical protein